MNTGTSPLMRLKPYDLVRELNLFTDHHREERKEFEKVFADAIEQAKGLPERAMEQYVAQRIGLFYLELLRKKWRWNRIQKLALMEKMIKWLQEEDKFLVIAEAVEGWPEKQRREEAEWRSYIDAQMVGC